METKIIVHRGTRQIGGCCTEITSNGTKILIDFGMPLPGDIEDELSIDGVTRGKTDCDGILITHYHGDHIGELKNIMAGVPVFMGNSTKKILEAYKEHMGEKFLNIPLDNVRTIQDGVEFCIGDIKITPIQSDHSSFQPYMFLLETDGKRILHTGDFRLHGQRSEMITDRLRTLGNIDLLITEGTTLSREGENWTEERVGNVFSRLLDKYKYCFLLTSSGNIDRISEFARRVKRGKYFITDNFQNQLLEIAKDNDGESKQDFNKVTVYGNNLKDKFENRGFGMIVRANTRFKNILRYYMTKHKEDTCLIYSMWTGYMEMPEIKSFIDTAGDNLYIAHSSGHVVLQDLNDMINIISPKQILFIHTGSRAEDIRIDLKERIIKVKDGEEFVL